VCWSIDIIYEFLIWCDFVYTLCVVCLPLWYTNNMYTLLLSSVLLTQCPSPLIPFHSITDLLSVHLLLIHSFSQLFVEREWCYLYVICFVPTVCIMKVLVIWQFVIPKVVEVWKWGEGEWMQSFCLYLLAIGGVPRLCILLLPSFPFFFDLQSSLPLKCIGDFIVTKSYISLCFLIFLWRTRLVTREYVWEGESVFL